jgi:hypothetical protein
MRTTVTLDPDVAASLIALAQERDVSFKEVLNSTLRAGLGAGVESPEPFVVRAGSWGSRPGAGFCQSLDMADELADEEIKRRWRRSE